MNQYHFFEVNKQQQGSVDANEVTMEARDHFKNGTNSKIRMNRIIFLLAILFLPLSLLGQIKMAEDKPPQPKEPEWLKYKDILLTPYDSSYYVIDTYPCIDAYKKYIGQQLYLPPNFDPYSPFLYSDKMVTVKGKNRYTSETIEKNSYVYLPDTERWLSRGDYSRDDDFGHAKTLGNKYFKIIDVLSRSSEICIKHGPNIVSALSADRWHIPKDPNGRSLKISYDSYPYFVLEEIQSGEKVYTAQPIKFIIVGGFEKKQQEYIGQNIVQVKETMNDLWVSSPNFEERHKYRSSNFIAEKWKCTEVVLSGQQRDKYKSDYKGSNETQEYYINLVLQSAEDSTKETIIDYRRLLRNNYREWEWTTEKMYVERWDKIYARFEAEEKKRNEVALERAKRDVAFKKQLEEEEAKRKQKLTDKYGASMAEKIIAGKLEIGMSKAVCAEIAIYASIIDQTATTETWKVTLWTSSESYLYFSGDKLVRIVNR